MKVADSLFAFLWTDTGSNNANTYLIRGTKNILVDPGHFHHFGYVRERLSSMSMAAEDIGKCAYGVFRRGTSTVGQRIGIAGEILSGPEMAAKFANALGRKVGFNDVPFDVYRGLGFPGAEDLGNMFQYQAILGDEFTRSRDVALSRSLNPGLLSFDAWLAKNKGSIPLE